MKQLLAIAALVLLALTSMAWAQGMSSSATAVTGPPTAAQKQAFWDETAPLRQSMWEKQDQLRTMLGNKNADPAQIGTLQQEIYQLRQEIAQKAQDAGMGYGRGRGWGCGGGRGGMRGMGYGMRSGTCPFAYQQ
jgi:hypothetical protein